jgi:hypothetical protein
MFEIYVYLDLEHSQEKKIVLCIFYGRVLVVLYSTHIQMVQNIVGKYFPEEKYSRKTSLVKYLQAIFY